MNLFKRKESIVKTEDSDMDLFDRIDQSYEKFSKMSKNYRKKRKFFVKSTRRRLIKCTWRHLIKKKKWIIIMKA